VHKTLSNKACFLVPAEFSKGKYRLCGHTLQGKSLRAGAILQEALNTKAHSYFKKKMENFLHPADVFHQVYFGIIFSLLVKQTAIVGVAGAVQVWGMGGCTPGGSDSLLIRIRGWDPRDLAVVKESVL
jgi:hypothetical protein